MKRVMWYISDNTPIGIVQLKNLQGQHYYYIGVGIGHAEEEKIESIIAKGAKFPHPVGELLFMF